MYYIDWPLIYWGVITLGIVIMVVLLIPILLEIRRTLKSTNRVIALVEEELEPTLKNVSSTTGSVSELTDDLTRKFKATTRFLNTFVLITKGADKIKHRFDPYTKPFAIRALSFLAGLKKGFEIVTAKPQKPERAPEAKPAQGGKKPKIIRGRRG